MSTDFSPQSTVEELDGDFTSYLSYTLILASLFKDVSSSGFLPKSRRFLEIYPRLRWRSLRRSPRPLSRKGLLAFVNRSFAPSPLEISHTSNPPFGTNHTLSIQPLFKKYSFHHPASTWQRTILHESSFYLNNVHFIYPASSTLPRTISSIQVLLSQESFH